MIIEYTENLHPSLIGLRHFYFGDCRPNINHEEDSDANHNKHNLETEAQDHAD